MATSPECVRVAFGAARTFSDLALDALREAVLLIDIRQHHKPVLLANAAAGRFFADGADGEGAKALLPHFAKVGSQTDPGKGQ